MSVQYVNSSGLAPNANADGTLKPGSSGVSQDQFLQLLVTQLKNQDPNNPTDQTQMLAQLAQFSQLSEMQSLNHTMTAASSFSQVSQSAALIGKTVTTSGDTATAGVTGVVSSVSVSGGKTYLHIGNQDVDSSTVTQIQ